MYFRFWIWLKFCTFLATRFCIGMFFIVGWWCRTLKSLADLWGNVLPDFGRRKRGWEMITCNSMFQGNRFFIWTDDHSSTCSHFVDQLFICLEKVLGHKTSTMFLQDIGNSNGSGIPSLPNMQLADCCLISLFLLSESLQPERPRPWTKSFFVLFFVLWKLAYETNLRPLRCVCGLS